MAHYYQKSRVTVFVQRKYDGISGCRVLRVAVAAVIEMNAAAIC